MPSSGGGWRMPRMLDLCSGLGGASEAMKRHGWQVVRIDNNPKVSPDIVADICHLPIDLPSPELLWVSPPCEEYSAKYQFGSWHPNSPNPDPAIWLAGLAAIAQLKPRFYVIENVRGAQKVWGKADYHFASRYLWTNIPLMCRPSYVPWKMGRIDRVGRAKGNKKPTYLESSRIPYELSDTIRVTVEALL